MTENRGRSLEDYSKSKLKHKRHKQAENCGVLKNIKKQKKFFKKKCKESMSSLILDTVKKRAKDVKSLPRQSKCETTRPPSRKASKLSTRSPSEIENRI